ncbi:MAG: PAS domain S-box protein, partial [Bacteroidota bacterium]
KKVIKLNYYKMSDETNNQESNMKNEIPDIFDNNEWISKILLRMGDAVIATDTKGIVLSMNKVAEDLTGWNLSESRGKLIDGIFNAINDQTLFPIQNPIYKALEENKEILLANHTVLIHKDKTQRIIVDSAVPVHDADSNVIGGALIFRDITEQSHDKKKLVENESLLKSIMENTSLLIYIKDTEGNYLLINRQKEKVYNIKASELIGKKSTSHLTAEEAAESEKTDLRSMLENRVIEFEQVIRHADGICHIYHTSKFPLFDSEHKVYAVCSMSTDITESKKNIEMKEKLAMQEMLLKSEMRYDKLTKNMPSMFFSLDHSLLHTSFNRACEKFTGIKEEEVIGKTIDEAFNGEALPFIEEYKEVLESGKAKSFISTFTYHKYTFTFNVNVYPTEKGISVLMTDLTSQKKAEEETLDLVDHLQKKNKDLRLFAYTVSHDLRAPITRVLGLASLFKNDPGFKMNNRTLLENVANEITNLDNVVKDMNAIISVRDEDKRKEFINFTTELNLVKKVLEKEIFESQAVITVDFQKCEGILTVKSYLYSILYNLLSNAIKYRSPGIPLTIHLESQQDNEIISLSVKDNGMGIDMKKNANKLFGLYNRFHGKNIEGKGIGLNLVKAQAESLGGLVEVESSVGHGSTFSVFLPINHSKDAAA